jgi:hypothetical protein
MSAKLTAREFIRRAQQIHGKKKYKYSQVKYKNGSSKVKIICSIHGVFEQAPHNHCLQKQGCPSCGREKSTLTRRPSLKQFISKAKLIHGSKYNYSKTIYKSSTTPLLIICPRHGSFWQRANNHLNGQGCAKCGTEKSSEKRRYSKKEFFNRVRKIHHDKYSYVETTFTGVVNRMEIICPVHGLFKQLAYMHLEGKGCRRCGRVVVGDKLRLSTETFVRRANKIHRNLYTYKRAEYSGACSKVVITCPSHGHFSQNPFNHLNGAGCPVCNNSKGERKVWKFLKDHGVLFRTEANIIPSNKKLSFDFQLTDDDVLIEYHGRQHYQVVDFSSRNPQRAKQAFLAGKKRDLAKSRWAKRNGYRLIVIPYWKNVEEVLTKELGVGFRLPVAA